MACAVLGAVLAVSCGPREATEPARDPRATTPPASVSPTDAPRHHTFTATVRIGHDDRARGRKGFGGVMLVKDDGERWVVSYEADPLWSRFENARVVIEGQEWTPPGQALVARHIRVGAFRHAERRHDGRPVDYTEVGPVQSLRGRFVDVDAEPGTKSEGERFLHFVTEDGQSHAVLHGGDPPRGRVVTVRARSYDMVQLVSVAAVAGPHLWIESVDER
jgi:hypothetical protein